MLGGKDNAEVDGDKRIIGFGRAVDRMGIWLTGNGGVGGENEGSGWGERVESVGRERGVGEKHVESGWGAEEEWPGRRVGVLIRREAVEQRG